MPDISDCIMIGQVTAIDAAKCRCRVSFDNLRQTDGTAFTTGWMQILQPRTVNAQDYSMPEIGEHVLCVFLPNSIEDGFVIGSYYTDSNMPKNGEIGIYRTEYADGTIIEYDLNTSTARINSEYTVEVKAETVNVEATNINITGNVTINGILTVTDDAIISGISSKNHVHGGVYSGSSTTNPPQ